MEGGLPPDYVLNEMQPFEIEIALEGLHLKHKELWEAARMIMYSVVQSHNSKRIDPKSMMPLPWDDEFMETDYGPDPYEEMEKEMKNRLKQMNNAG